LAQANVPAIPPGEVTEKADCAAVISMASEKLTMILAPRGTPVAPFTGTTLVMVGGVVSGITPVTKEDANALASGLPARSRAPVPTPTVYIVL